MSNQSNLRKGAQILFTNHDNLKSVAFQILQISSISQPGSQSPPLFTHAQSSVGSCPVTRCWSILGEAASLLRSTDTDGSDGRRVEMPRLRVSLQGPHPASVFPQRLPGMRSEHHRPDSGGGDPGAEPSLGQL